jgi:Flp pilus assembly protein CpaB
MHRSAVVRWGAAALVAIVTSVVVASDLATLHRRARSIGPERTVVVAAHDLALGATIRDTDLRTRVIHESQLPKGATTEIDDVRGRVVVIPVIEGSFVTGRHVAPADREGLAAVVPTGSRAVRVEPISAPRLQPGDLVDVLATFDGGGTVQGGLAATAALVIHVDADVDVGSRSGVTLLVRASEVDRMAEAIAVGSVILALAAPEETAAVNSPHDPDR